VRGRRAILTAVALLIAAGISTGATSPAVSAPVGPEKPNILVVVTDDQRGGLEVMPHTRKLIRNQGVKFSQAYATTPLCCPSRSSIFTGQYAHNHNVKKNVDTPNLDHSTTIQRYLSEAGYVTGMFGKFLNKWPVENAPPYFDKFTLLRTGGSKIPRYFDAQWNVNGKIGVSNGYSTNLLGKQVVKFLNERETGKKDRRPWYVYLAPNAPHSPFQASKKYEDAPVPVWFGNPAVFEEDKSDKPPYIAAATNGFNRGAKVRRMQFRTLMSVDDMVERVLTRMRQLGENRDTLVIYVSDNGISWAEHGIRGKNVPYRVVSRVPLLMKWWGHTAPGAIDRRLTANIDIAPTLADAADIEDRIDHTMDGRSLLDVTWERDRLLLESYVPDWASTLTTDYQYTEYYEENGQTAEFHEYYDLVNDPWQLDNLFVTDPTSLPPNVAALKAQLSLDRSCAGDDCP
jgi:arylsulfatase A-like enzyme